VVEEKCDGTFVLLEEMIHPAVIHLAMRGHTRILCPMQKGRELSRDKVWKLLLKETRFKMTQAAFADAFPVQDLTEAGTLGAFWEKQHRQYRPTAVIVQDFHHLLSFHQFCIGHGLSIPRDVSVIGVFDHPSLRWLAPNLSRFVVPTRRMSRKIIQWVERTEDAPQGLALVPPEAIEGSTVGDPR
jgi:DNA-binding LacI/PurR family transcriptional regulator